MLAMMSHHQPLFSRSGSVNVMKKLSSNAVVQVVGKLAESLLVYSLQNHLMIQHRVIVQRR